MTQDRRSRFNDLTPRIEAESEPETGLVLVILDDADGWRVQWTVETQNGIAVARELILTPSRADLPDGGITSNLLRELSPLRAVGHIPWRFDRARLRHYVDTPGPRQGA